VDQMVNSYAGLVNNIAGASDNTKQALLETVNTSSQSLLQKLDATQQDLLKQTQDSHSVLETVAKTQTTLAKKVDSGNEFTQRRLVEMEGSIERKVDGMNESLTRTQTQSSETVLASLRADFTKLAEQGNAIVDSTEKSAAAQEERMSDVRRQNMMILDMLTNAQETMMNSAESLQSFTRSEIMRDSAANMETAIRDQILTQFNKMQDAFMGDGEESSDNSFKAAVNAMVMKLEESASRLELANSNTGDRAQEQAEFAEGIKQELQAVALALSQQQRDVAQENLAQVGEAVRAELGQIKEAQASTAGALTEQVTQLSTSVAESVSRLESGVDKMLQTVESAGAKPEGKRSTRGADRG